MKDVASAKLKLVKSHSGNTDVFDGIQGLYNEDYFNRMLSLERKRTQRSKKPFMLMLIDISKLINPHPNLVVINSIGRVLEAGIRETDVRGWYRKGHIIGVVFTELESACAAVRDKIFGKLLMSLAGEIDPKDLEKIKVSFHVFPEDQDKGNCSGHFNMNLYKDLLEGEKKNGVSRKMKRLMDIVGSLLALIIFSPIILAVAAAVKLTSGDQMLGVEILECRGMDAAACFRHIPLIGQSLDDHSSTAAAASTAPSANVLPYGVWHVLSLIRNLAAIPVVARYRMHSSV